MLNKLSTIKRTVCVVLLLSLLYTLFTPISAISLITNSSYLSPESNTPPILINSDEDFVNYNFDGDGSILNPYLIEDYRIVTTHKASISINDTTKHFVIRDCVLEGMRYGIYINNVAAGTAKIQENHFQNNDNYAIYLRNADSTIVTDNTFINNYETIRAIYSPLTVISNNVFEDTQYICISLQESNDVLVKNNTSNNTQVGLKFFICDSATIVNNEFYNNNFAGIQAVLSSSINIDDNECITSYTYGIQIASVDSSNITRNRCDNNDYGIYSHNSQSNHIFNNTCHNNINGIYLTAVSDSNFLMYNLLQSNIEYGMHIDLSDSNSVYRNSFEENNLGGTVHGFSQGYDNGTNNLWYNISLTEGNYWSDWSGSGSYLIDGIGGSVDLYPLPVSIIPVIAEDYLISFILLFATTLSFISIATIYRRRTI